MRRLALPGHMLVHGGLAAASFAVTLLWSDSVCWAICAAAVAVFLDVDHLLDYWLAHGVDFDWRRFLQETRGGGLYFLKSRRILILLHSWELVFLVWAGAVFFKVPQLGLSFSLGFIPHLLWDQFTYAKKPLMYFFAFRLVNRFRLNNICGEGARSCR